MTIIIFDWHETNFLYSQIPRNWKLPCHAGALWGSTRVGQEAERWREKHGQGLIVVSMREGKAGLGRAFRLRIASLNYFRKLGVEVLSLVTWDVALGVIRAEDYCLLDWESQMEVAHSTEVWIGSFVSERCAPRWVVCISKNWLGQQFWLQCNRPWGCCWESLPLIATVSFFLLA